MERREFRTVIICRHLRRFRHESYRNREAMENMPANIQTSNFANSYIEGSVITSEGKRKVTRRAFLKTPFTFLHNSLKANRKHEK